MVRSIAWLWERRIFPFTEFAELMKLLDGRKVKITTYISTSRGIREMLIAKGWLKTLQDAGITNPS